jgi:hypothetical protein
VERSVTRDTRRFAFYKWRLVEVPASIPFDPLRIWRERYGFLPPFGLGGLGGVVGAHFRVRDGARAVTILRPEPLQVPDSVRNRLFSVIAAKHDAAAVRLAQSGESPNLEAADRLPRPDDRAQIEEFTVEDARGRDSLVAELAMNAGVYLTGSIGWNNASGSIEDAALFETVAEAEGFLACLTSPPSVLLRFRAACLAEADQAEAAAIEGKAMPI